MSSNIRYTSIIPQAKAAITSAAMDGAAEGMYKVFQRSEAIVPLDEGPLQESGKLAINNKSVTLSYGFGESRAYAVDQHENLQYKHAPGRQAKYLEQPFRELTPGIISNIAKSIREVIQ